MPKAPKDERELPLGDQTTWVAKRLWRERRYGPGGVLRCDVVLVKRRPDRKEQVNPNLDLNPWCFIWLAFSEKRAARCNRQAKDKHCSAFLQDEEVALFASSQKGGRHWLKVKAAGKNWYWHRLVAWCFSNPRNLTWATYHKKDRQGACRYQAGHLGPSEVNCNVDNLKVMTKFQNEAMCRKDALWKHGVVFKG